MKKKLPRVLRHEPLIDAVFEVRFVERTQLSNILPGALFNWLESESAIQRLLTHEVPQPIRENSEELIYAPILRLELKRSVLLIGDRNIFIGCKLPYPKWPAFKGEILDLIGRISKIGIPVPVRRHSIRYVNLIETEAISAQIEKIAMSIRLGASEIKDNPVMLKVQRQEKDILHTISVVTNAQIETFDGRQLSGVVVDVESAREGQPLEFSVFAAQLKSTIESLRQTNKTEFFNCLKEATIQEMEPEYE